MTRSCTDARKRSVGLEGEDPLRPAVRDAAQTGLERVDFRLWRRDRVNGGPAAREAGQDEGTCDFRYGLTGGRL
jgi:hypothetical protein